MGLGGVRIRKGMMFGLHLRWFERILVVVNLVLITGILVYFFGQILVENCWDKYATEEQAISHCEQ